MKLITYVIQRYGRRKVSNVLAVDITEAVVDLILISAAKFVS